MTKTQSLAHRLLTETLANGGSTVSVTAPEAPTPQTGYAVALPLCERIVPLVSLTVDAIETYVVDRTNDLWSHPGAYVGAWVNDGSAYLDLSMVIEDKATALKVGAEYRQIAIYDLANGVEITL